MRPLLAKYPPPCHFRLRTIPRRGTRSRSCTRCEAFKVASFSSSRYVLEFLEQPLTQHWESVFIESRLTKETARLADGHSAVTLFVNDDADAKARGRWQVLEVLAEGGTRVIAMRCAGFDRVDVGAAESLGMKVVRVPTYSPCSVAEHSVALALALNRNLVAAHARVQQGNFTLSGLRGFEVRGKTIGIIGTGAIGTAAAKIWKGFGTRVLANDVRENPALEGMVEYVGLEELLRESHLVSLHCPLLPSTFHLLNAGRIAMMKEGAFLINVSRGGLLDTEAAIDALERGHIGCLGMDVYEEEGNLFFNDFTQFAAKDRLKAFDRKFQLLISFPQVLVTPHSAFLTMEALNNIATTTVENLLAFQNGRELVNLVKPM